MGLLGQKTNFGRRKNAPAMFDRPSARESASPYAISTEGLQPHADRLESKNAADL
jgi:hypothetical protein